MQDWDEEEESEEVGRWIGPVERKWENRELSHDGGANWSVVDEDFFAREGFCFLGMLSL